jgi:Cu2+-exporting ATPase
MTAIDNGQLLSASSRAFRSHLPERREINAGVLAGDARCAHCGLVVPSGLVDPEAEHQFCCAGCEAVFKTLNSCGLEAYYRLREADDAALRPVKLSDDKFESFDSPSFHKLYVQQRPDGLSTADLALEGVSCAACVWLVERLPRIVQGVVEARLSLREATVRITWDPREVALSKVARSLSRIGYTPHPARDQLGREMHRRESRRRLIHLGVAGAIMGNTMLLALALYSGEFGHMEEQYRMFFRWLSAALGLLSLTWPGATFFRSAYTALRMRATNLDVPIALALAVGGAAGLANVVLNRGDIYFDSLTVLVFLLLVGRFIQYRQQRRADDAVGLLFNLTPSSCRIVRGDEVTEAPIEALNAGDLVEVRPGELFPADGPVESGSSTMNQALLTGESMPVAVSPGSIVHAGAQNVGSVLWVRVNSVGRDTRVGRLMRLIERGVADKPPIVQFADRIGGIFVVVVTILAAIVFAFWSRFGLGGAIDHTVALLIVTCPCVLGLATPLTIAITIGRLARRDILVKSGTVIEKLAGGGEMMLDKTGTLTEGRMQLLHWAGESSWKRIVWLVEGRSNHPVGRALHESLGAKYEAEANDADISFDVSERGDGGICAEIHGGCVEIGSPGYMRRAEVTVPEEFEGEIRRLESDGITAVVVAVDRNAVAVAGLGDNVRDDAKSSVAQLEHSGWRASICSGDAREVVQSVGRRIGIAGERVFGQVSPEGKLSRIERRASDRAVVMVGDGVNDAAALAAADVGIAVHGGAEASLCAADVYIARPGLSAVVELVQCSRKTMQIVRRNLCISLGYNVLAGALAAAGLMTPMLAAILMPISSATVLSLTVAFVGRSRRSK